jgi:hypothetical protein
MKQIIIFFTAAFMLSSCAGEVTIAQNEQGLFGLKKGSRWVAEPVYVKLVKRPFKAGDFFIAKKVPSTQKYYHVVYDANGKLVKECNIYAYLVKGNGYLKLMTPEGPLSTFYLDTRKENLGKHTTNYAVVDIFSDDEWARKNR